MWRFSFEFQLEFITLASLRIQPLYRRKKKKHCFSPLTRLYILYTVVREVAGAAGQLGERWLKERARLAKQHITATLLLCFLHSLLASQKRRRSVHAFVHPSSGMLLAAKRDVIQRLDVRVITDAAAPHTACSWLRKLQWIMRLTPDKIWDKGCNHTMTGCMARN